MSSTTFEGADNVAAKMEQIESGRIKQMFIELLEELKTLKTQWEKTRAGFQTRLSRIHQRVQQAEKAGVPITQASHLVGPVLNEIQGRGHAKAGLLPSIGRQIENGISTIERVSEEPVPRRQEWGTWAGIPSCVREKIRAVEERLAGLENLVADGGPLHDLIEQAAGRKTTQGAA